MKVGELAERTGVSVRTLHHYDEIGLLSPSGRTPSGHRDYAPGDVARLLRIVALRQLGLALEEVRAALDRRESPRAVVERRLARALEERRAHEELCRRLKAVASRLRDDAASLDDVVRAIEGMTMYEKYCSKEQVERLEARRRALGEDGVRRVNAEWPAVLAQVRDAHARGLDPASDEVQALMRRMDALLEAMTGGDEGLLRSLTALYRGEPEVRARYGLDGAVERFLREARAARRRGA